MSTNSHLVNCYWPKNLSYHCQDTVGKCKTFNETKGQFVKLNIKKNRIRYGLGHSQMMTNNFSRRNSGATITSTVSSTNSTVNSRPTKSNATQFSNHTSITNLSKIQPQKSWSLPNIEFGQDNKKTDKFELTEQRFNYERMTERQRQQPWSSEHVVRYNMSNSRIPTYSIDQNQHNDVNDKKDNSVMKLGDAINTEFLALREFRYQNIRDCFGDRRQQELQLTRAQTPQNVAETSVGSDHQAYALNWYTDKNCKILKNNANLSKTSTMPYAARQRLLRERLAKELPKKSSTHFLLKNMGLNKSIALSYQSMY